MKAVSLFLLICAASGCSPATNSLVSGRYAAEDETIIETIDLAEGGAAMHAIELKSKDNPEISQFFDDLKLSQVRWSQKGNKVEVMGLFNGPKEKQREVVWVFEVQPNGDLVRHGKDGEFERFRKM